MSKRTQKKSLLKVEVVSTWRSSVEAREPKSRYAATESCPVQDGRRDILFFKRQGKRRLERGIPRRGKTLRKRRGDHGSTTGDPSWARRESDSYADQEADASPQPCTETGTQTNENRRLNGRRMHSHLQALEWKVQGEAPRSECDGNQVFPRTQKPRHPKQANWGGKSSCTDSETTSRKRERKTSAPQASARFHARARQVALSGVQTPGGCPSETANRVIWRSISHGTAALHGRFLESREHWRAGEESLGARKRGTYKEQVRESTETSMEHRPAGSARQRRSGSGEDTFLRRRNASYREGKGGRLTRNRERAANRLREQTHGRLALQLDSVRGLSPLDIDNFMAGQRSGKWVEFPTAANRFGTDLLLDSDVYRVQRKG
ncbi:hypothetical protein TGVEG_281530 [Toxoplasma gondii VEG]|uniref:Uncharacterized protein n=1 Tax=Toxoplasma gondii (strain ATCC 50861 / VEG) TaxID=432359 RepID=V5BBJ0_TOXGV|nr:hypothetical protein TGVEG_281530 [Toxoplasma gondii VEG]